MKKLSLSIKELISEICPGIACFVIGLLQIIFQLNLRTTTIHPAISFMKIMLLLTIVIQIAAIVLDIKNKFDITDEIAKINYAKSKTITVKIFTYLLIITTLMFIIFDLKINISFEHIMTVLGLYQLLQGVLFIILETRGNSHE